jgi:hypothetical protein
MEKVVCYITPPTQRFFFFRLFHSAIVLPFFNVYTVSQQVLAHFQVFALAVPLRKLLRDRLVFIKEPFATVFSEAEASVKNPHHNRVQIGTPAKNDFVDLLRCLGFDACAALVPKRHHRFQNESLVSSSQS